MWTEVEINKTGRNVNACVILWTIYTEKLQVAKSTLFRIATNLPPVASSNNVQIISIEHPENNVKNLFKMILIFRYKRRINFAWYWRITFVIFNTFLKSLRRKSFEIFRQFFERTDEKIKMFWNLKKIVVYYSWCSCVICLILQEIL